MKVPGLAWLEMTTTDDGAGGSHYRQRAVFFPTGLGGRLYWMAILPFHGVIFSGMANRITTAAALVEAARPADAQVGTPLNAASSTGIARR